MAKMPSLGSPSLLSTLTVSEFDSGLSATYETHDSPESIVTTNCPSSGREDKEYPSDKSPPSIGDVTVSSVILKVMSVMSSSDAGGFGPSPLFLSQAVIKKTQPKNMVIKNFLIIKASTRLLKT